MTPRICVACSERPATETWAGRMCLCEQCASDARYKIPKEVLLLRVGCDEEDVFLATVSVDSTRGPYEVVLQSGNGDQMRMDWSDAVKMSKAVLEIEAAQAAEGR